jgi:hypothetical protein
MAKTRVFLCLSMLLIVAAIGACGVASDLVTDPSDGDRGTSRSGSSVNDDSVEAILEAAKLALRHNVTGRFIRKVTYRPEDAAKTVFWASTGSYDIEHRRSRGTATLNTPGERGRLPFEFASDDRKRLIRSIGWPCWVVLRPDDFPGVAVLNPTPGAFRLPGEIAGLLLAQPTNFPSDGPSDVIDVLVPLRIAAGLVGGTTVYGHVAGRMADLPIPATIHLDKGQFVSWSVQGDDIEYGLNLVGGLAEFDTDLSRVKIRVRLRDVGAVGPVRLPPRSDWVRLPPRAEDLDATACERTTV